MEDYQPENRLKEGTQIFILSLDQQKVWKTGRFSTSTKTAHHCLWWCFLHENFSSAGGTDQLILPATLRQARPHCRLPDIMLLDMTSFTALALQMGHELKDIPHDYWPRLMAAHSRFIARPWHETDFYTYSIFCKMQKRQYVGLCV